MSSRIKTVKTVKAGPSTSKKATAIVSMNPVLLRSVEDQRAFDKIQTQPAKVSTGVDKKSVIVVPIENKKKSRGRKGKGADSKAQIQLKKPVITALDSNAIKVVHANEKILPSRIETIEVESETEEIPLQSVRADVINVSDGETFLVDKNDPLLIIEQEVEEEDDNDEDGDSEMKDVKQSAEEEEKKKLKRIGSKIEVFNGLAKRTSGGLTADDLMENDKGNIVSKKRHNIGKSRIQNILPNVESSKEKQ